jgi:hypothetical protein
VFSQVIPVWLLVIQNFFHFRACIAEGKLFDVLCGSAQKLQNHLTPTKMKNIPVTGNRKLVTVYEGWPYETFRPNFCTRQGHRAICYIPPKLKHDQSDYFQRGWKSNQKRAKAGFRFYPCPGVDLD